MTKKQTKPTFGGLSTIILIQSFSHLIRSIEDWLRFPIIFLGWMSIRLKLLKISIINMLIIRKIAVNSCDNAFYFKRSSICFELCHIEMYTHPTTENVDIISVQRFRKHAQFLKKKKISDRFFCIFWAWFNGF